LGRNALSVTRGGLFGGPTGGLSVGHVAPEAADGGASSFLHDRDTSVRDIGRAIFVDIELRDCGAFTKTGFRCRHLDYAAGDQMCASSGSAAAGAI
jgi:hypothetical protein